MGADAATEEIRQATAAEEKNMEEYIQTMSKLMKAMIETTLLQKNVNMTIKEGLLKLQEALNSPIESRRATSTAHRRLKEKKTIKRNVEEVISPESEMTPAGKKLKELARQEEVKDPPGTPLFRFPDENTWQVVLPRKIKKKGDKGEKTPGSVTKSKTTEKQGSTNKLRRPRAKAVLVKPAEGKSYADVLHKIKDSVDPSTTQTVFKTIRCTRGGGGYY